MEWSAVFVALHVPLWSIWFSDKPVYERKILPAAILRRFLTNVVVVAVARREGGIVLTCMSCSATSTYLLLPAAALRLLRLRAAFSA